MLVAANKNLLRIHNKNKFDLIEDEITSTVFGPLRYFQAEEVWKFFESLLKPNLKEIKLWPKKVEPLTVDFKFWPTLKKLDTKKTPDLIIEFSSNGKLIIQLIIEVKWGKNGCQSSTQESTKAPSQLAEQWGHLKCEKRKRSIHIYLAWSKSKLKKEFDHMFDPKKGLEFSKFDFSKKEWQKRLVGMTWGEMVYYIQCREGEELFV